MDSSDILHFSTALMGFFAVMNPFANTPIFLGLTAGMDAAQARSVAIRGCFIAFVIVSVFAVAGNVIFNIFAITLPAFRIAGGVLIAGVGFHLLNGGNTAHGPNKHESGADGDIAVSPLAVPILGGPGTIVTAMSFVADETPERVIVTVVACGLMALISAIFFIGGERISRVLGAGVMSMISRLMGLILAVIGAQMLIEGIAGAIRAYGG